VVNGPQGSRLRDMAVPPRELTESGGRLRLNSKYYILKQIIPALDRALSLVGADLKVRLCSLTENKCCHAMPCHGWAVALVLPRTRAAVFLAVAGRCLAT
jgi:hypothetical protein